MKRRLSCARERSVTPGPEDRPKQRPESAARRQLMVNMAKAQDRDVFVEPDPKVWKPPPNMIAHEVFRTPGGSLRVSNPVQIDRTPRGSIKRKTELEQSIHIAAAERVAACDMDEEDANEIMVDNYDHVRKWVSELPPPETMLVGYQSCSKPVLERPSTSGKTVSSKGPTKGLVDDGSDFDSDFDNEFDLNEIAATAGISRGIPDHEELDEPVANIISSMEKAMDEAIERLVDVSTDFEWQVDFNTFRGVPENFSGDTPGSVKDYDTPYDVFIDIWSRDIMEHIVRETNRYANQVIGDKIAAGTLKDSSRLHRWVNTDVDELYVLFAVYILMGIDSRSSQHEYFKCGGFLEMPKFRTLLTYNRFMLLNRFLHFADNSDASPELLQSEGDVLSPKLRRIAPILSHLNARFQTMYNLHQDVAIDESLTLFKGRLSWIQAITKAARFGIKSYELCESRTGYLYKFFIYTGKNSERGHVTAPNVDLAGKSTQVVLDLLKGLERRGHCVTALARYLKTLGFDCLGTLRPNRKNVPKEIAKASKNVPKGTIIALHSGDVSCLAWKDTKMVNMISTYHTAETFVGKKAGRDLVKPVAVRDYNNTMGGVDLKDQKLSMYLMERKRCLKWTMKIFKRLLNVSVHNALILLLSCLKRRGMPEILHRDFREQLAKSLVEAHCPSLREISAPASEVMRLRKDIVHLPQILTRTTRVQCHLCKRKDIKKLVNTKCVTCDEGICFEGCWSDWHSLQQLPGRNVFVRKTNRRH